MEPATLNFSNLPRTSVARLYDPRTGTNLIKLDGFPKLMPGKTWQERLKEIIEEKGVLSMTTNQTLLRQLVEGGAIDSRIDELAREGRSVEEIYETLYTEAALEAARIFSRIHQALPAEGRVSHEASALITEIDPLVEAARKIHAGFIEGGGFTKVPNLGGFTKVPNLAIGPQAVRRAVREGVNVNVTLVFGMRHYVDTAEAYVLGLKDRVDRSLPVRDIDSVNSLFVSRLDRTVDKFIDEAIRQEIDESKRARLRILKGKVAVAQAKLIYRIFESIFLGKRFEDQEGLWTGREGQAMLERIRKPSEIFQGLQARGAKLQRILIASSGVKEDQPYDKLLYVLPFLGPYTANTVPEGTLDAFSAFVATLTEEETDSLKKRSFISEPLPRIEQRLDNRSEWRRAVLQGAEERMSPDRVLRELQEFVLGPFGKTLAGITDEIRDKGAEAFAEDERATIEVIGKRIANGAGRSESPLNRVDL